MRIHRTKGFTLIELLVVVAIIGLLSAIVLSALNTAHIQANDAARAQDTKALKNALEYYYLTNNVYPPEGTEGTGYSISVLAAYLVPQYISAIPSLLVSDGDLYVYRTTGGAGGNGYGLYVKTEGSGYCVSGFNVDPTWWNSTPACVF